MEGGMDLHVRGQREFNSYGIYYFLYREGSNKLGGKVMGFSEERYVPSRNTLTDQVDREGQDFCFLAVC